MVWYRDWQAIHGNEKRGRYILFCILLSGGYAVGIACEYFINPMFLDMAKKLITFKSRIKRSDDKKEPMYIIL